MNRPPSGAFLRILAGGGELGAPTEEIGRETLNELDAVEQMRAHVVAWLRQPDQRHNFDDAEAIAGALERKEDLR